jgi:hypothetical protein
MEPPSRGYFHIAVQCRPYYLESSKMVAPNYSFQKRQKELEKKRKKEEKLKRKADDKGTEGGDPSESDPNTDGEQAPVEPGPAA